MAVKRAFDEGSSTLRFANFRNVDLGCMLSPTQIIPCIIPSVYEDEGYVETMESVSAQQRYRRAAAAKPSTENG